MGGRSPKQFFRPFRPQFSLKLRAGPLPWIRHCVARGPAVYSDLWDVTVHYTCRNGERDSASKAAFCLLESGGEKETLPDSRQIFEVAAIRKILDESILFPLVKPTFWSAYIHLLITAISPGFETASWQHAAHAQQRPYLIGAESLSSTTKLSKPKKGSAGRVGERQFGTNVFS